MELSKPATWIKVNNDFRMYYITNYDLVGWKKLYHQLVEDHTVFTTTGRLKEDTLINSDNKYKLMIAPNCLRGYLK